MLVGTVLQGSSYTIAQLVVGQIVTGLGNGINTSTAPMYQAGTTKARSRGRMISLEGWFITIGIVISYWITHGTASSPIASIQFQTPIVLQAVFGIMTVIMLFRLPESPRYLMAQGRNAEALLVISQLEGEPEDSIAVQKQYAAIEAALAVEKTGPIHIKDYFEGGQKQTFRRLLLGYGIQMMQQLTGISAVIFYSSYLLQNTLGLERNLSLVVAGCTGLAYFVFTFTPILFIDKWGRRVSLMLVAGVIFVMVYIAVYSGFDWVTGPWLYPTEINQLRFRSKGTALATSSNWLWNFVVVEITPVGAQNLS